MDQKQRNVVRTMKWQQQRWYDGRCVQCGQPHDRQTRRCNACLEKQNDYQKRTGRR